jgi:hypothetical protein
MEALRSEQPQHDQRRVKAIVASCPGIDLKLFEKIGWEQFLEPGRKPGKGGVRNEWRERECGSCLKPTVIQRSHLCKVLLDKKLKDPLSANSSSQKLCGIRLDSLRHT